MSILNALASGVAGAVTLNLIHESVRRALPHAPRVDVIGTRAVRRSFEAVGRQPPPWGRAHQYALAGDLASNTAYYSLAALGDPRGAVARGVALGLIGGVGAVVLPPLLGLGQQPHRKSPWTEMLTVAWYTAGGYVAGKLARTLAE
jgi:hypothetical protein